MNAAEENVLSLAGNFSPTCDGHLVSVEKDGRYKTQTLSIVLKENRKGILNIFFHMIGTIHQVRTQKTRHVAQSRDVPI